MIPRGTISKVGRYYITSPEYTDEINRAFKEFFGKSHLEENEEPLFNEWLTYDFKFSDGKSMLEKYYTENPHDILDYKRKIYETLLENYYGLFEVVEVKRYVGLSIKRLKDGKIFDVSEVSATMDLDVEDIFVTRVGKVIDHYELVGCDTKVIKVSQSQDEKKKKFYMDTVFLKVKMDTPKDAIVFFRNFLGTD
jgi:hypothetical protein